MRKPIDLSLYLVTNSELTLGRSLLEVVEEAVKGGVTLVQLREKEASSLDFYREALAMKKLLAPYGVPLIINDRVDIALAVDADGLHIGQGDLPYAVARDLLGEDKIIGLSVENTQDVLIANELDIDYIGISPVFLTDTKQDTASALGIEGARAINKLSNKPSVGIGGIHLDNVADIIATGSEGVSVVSAIVSAPSPREAAQQLKEIIIKTKNNGE